MEIPWKTIYWLLALAVILSFAVTMISHNASAAIITQKKHVAKVRAVLPELLVESNGADLVETDSTFHTDLSRELFENVPLESSTSSVSSLVTSFS